MIGSLEDNSVQSHTFYRRFPLKAESFALLSATFIVSGNIISQLVGFNLLSYFSAAGGVLAIVSAVLGAKKLDPVDLLVFFQILFFVAVTSTINGQPVLIVETILALSLVFVGQLLNEDRFWKIFEWLTPLAVAAVFISVNSNVFERPFNYHLIAHGILLFFSFQVGKIFSSGKLPIYRLVITLLLIGPLLYLPGRTTIFIIFLLPAVFVFLRYPRTIMLLSPLFIYLMVFGFSLMLDTFADQAWAKRTLLLAEFSESPRAELWLTVLGLFEMPWGVIGYGAGGAALKLAELGYETPHNILAHIYIDFGLLTFVLVLTLLLRNHTKVRSISAPLISIIVFLIFQFSKSFSFYDAGILFLFLGMAKKLKNSQALNHVSKERSAR